MDETSSAAIRSGVPAGRYLPLLPPPPSRISLIWVPSEEILQIYPRSAVPNISSDSVPHEEYSREEGWILSDWIHRKLCNRLRSQTKGCQHHMKSGSHSLLSPLAPPHRRIIDLLSIGEAQSNHNLATRTWQSSTTGIPYFSPACVSIGMRYGTQFSSTGGGGGLIPATVNFIQDQTG